ncbi:hypothetical protein E8E14_012877 [Neopestalotiopsis sp. 37M]|nr:hypothetical protein E8E14_012877 [Neopestalotiopsis sp. 37M]
MDMSTTEHANLTVNKNQPSVEEPQPVAEQASQAAERSEVEIDQTRLVEAKQPQHSENFSDTKSNVAQSDIKGKAVKITAAIERDMVAQSARYRSSGIYQGLLINRSLSPMPLAQQYVYPREEYGEVYIAMLSKEEPRRMVIVRFDKSTGRPSNRPVDAWTTDNPANDTKKIFLQQFQTMARIHGATWEDGQHLSPATRENS